MPFNTHKVLKSLWGIEPDAVCAASDCINLGLNARIMKPKLRVGKQKLRSDKCKFGQGKVVLAATRVKGRVKRLSEYYPC